MLDLGALKDMPPKPKKKSAKAGRPAEPEPMRSLVSLKGTAEFETWVDELVDHLHLGTRSLLMKNALRVIAEQSEFKKPQPKR